MKKLLLLTALISFSNAFAQLSPIYDSIPMRDGKKLPITRFMPSGCTSCPTILIQTPYNRLLFNLALPLNVGININASPYNYVVMDWRGFYGAAAAAYVGMPTRGEDGYDAVEWIAAQPWNNGKVATWGPSALGKVQFQTAAENPPHLTCIVPLVAGPQFNYNEYYPGGVYRTEYVEQLDNLGYGLSASLLANPVKNGLWNYLENINFYPDSIRVPAFMIGGWYDHTPDLMLDFFNALRTTSTGVQNDHRLLMGPWVHGGSGTASVGSATQGQLTYTNAADDNDSLALLFLEYHLQGVANGWDTTPYIRYYQMGTNTWQTTNVWPPADVTPVNLYLHTDGTLDSGLPTSGTGSLSYSYNPLDPSPTVGGCTLRGDLDQGPYDQAPVVESRTDVLKFTSAVLGADVVLKGKVTAHLKIASNKKDTDFAVRLTDVYPDGRSMLLVDGIVRARFRDGFYAADTIVMVPGTIYNVDVDLPPTCITFLAGHQIRVDISSSIYPKYNRNDNSGGVMYPGGSGDSLRSPSTATNTIYTNSTNASYITMPIVDFIGGWEEVVLDENALQVYPNPANGAVHVAVQNGKLEQLNVYDAKGLLVMDALCNVNKMDLNINTFDSGIYLLVAKTDKGNYCKKLIVE